MLDFLAKKVNYLWVWPKPERDEANATELFHMLRLSLRSDEHEVKIDHFPLGSHDRRFLASTSHTPLRNGFKAGPPVCSDVQCSHCVLGTYIV